MQRWRTFLNFLFFFFFYYISTSHLDSCVRYIQTFPSVILSLKVFDSVFQVPSFNLSQDVGLYVNQLPKSQ